MYKHYTKTGKTTKQQHNKFILSQQRSKANRQLVQKYSIQDNNVRSLHQANNRAKPTNNLYKSVAYKTMT